MKYSLFKLFCLVFALSLSVRALACTSNAQCVNDPNGPTCIDGVCDSCCNAPVSNEFECTGVADTCVWNEEYGACQDNEIDLCPASQIPEAPFSAASRWLWLVLAVVIVGGTVFLRKKKAPPAT